MPTVATSSILIAGRHTVPSDYSDRVAARYARFYLCLAAPTCMALTMLIGPFGVADEPAHFLRAVALSTGRILPETSDRPVGSVDRSGRSAGAQVDIAAAAFARRYDLPITRKDLTVRPSLDTLLRDASSRPTGRTTYAAHSNTAIYPPLLYPAPTVAMAIGARIGLPVLLWLYLARILTAALGIAIGWWAIRHSRDKAPAFLALAMLPGVIFQMAGVSADGLLLPIFLLFAVSISRLSARAPFGKADAVSTGVSTIFVAAGKVAYLPLALLVPLSTILSGRGWSRRDALLAISAVIGVLLWSIWTWLVHDKVFSIRAEYIVDPAMQFGHLFGRPAHAIAFLLHEAAVGAPKLIWDACGRYLGWREILLPLWFAPLTMLTIATATLLAPVAVDRRRPLFVAAVILSVGCYLAMFLLLYAQYNPVDAIEIDGMQGRYLIPLVIVLASLSPRLHVPERWTRVTPVMVVAWSMLSAGMTLWVTIQRFWL